MEPEEVGGGSGVVMVIWANVTSNRLYTSI